MTNNSALTTVLPSRRTSSPRPTLTYSLNVGTSAATSAPLKTPKSTIGTVEALTYASISARVPK